MPARPLIAARCSLAIALSGGLAASVPGADGDPPSALLRGTMHCPVGPLAALDLALRVTEGGYEAAGVVILDRDGDGRNEFIVGGTGIGDARLQIFNANNARIGNPTAVTNGFDDLLGAWRLQTDDLDGDGDADLIAYSQFGPRIAVGRNDGGEFVRAAVIDWEFLQGDIRRAADGARSIVHVDRDLAVREVMLGDDLVPTGSRVVDDGPATHAIAIDVDDDGEEDLITGDAFGDRPFTLRIAEGGGGWSAPTPVDLGPMAFALATVADMDGDGRDDLVIPPGSAAAGGRVRILHGTGRGGFDPAVEIGAGADRGGFDLAVADFDGDGRMDVAMNFVGGAEPGIVVYRGLGNRAYETAAMLPAHVGATSQAQWVMLEAGDVTGDGVPDLVAGGAADVRVGTAGRMPGSTRLRPGRDLFTELVDIDGDGSFEVVGVNEHRIRVDRWDPDGDRFITLAEAPTAGTPIEMRTSVPVAGMAGAGPARVLLRYPELVSPTAVAYEVGEDAISATVPVDLSDFVDEVAEGDVDGDGDQDVVLLARVPERLILRPRTGEFLSQGIEYPLASMGRALTVGDVDGDGLADAVMIVAGPPRFEPQILVSWGDARLGLRAPEPVGVAGSGPLNDRRLLLVDWMGDGGTRDILVLGGRPRLLHRGSGGGWSGADVTRRDGALLFVDAESGAGDVDGDGRVDIIGRHQGYFTHMAYAIGGGSVDAPVVDLRNVYVPGQWTGGRAADLDGDGRTDVVSRSDRGQVAVFLNRPCAAGCPGDVDADGVVDFLDLLALLGPVDRSTSTPAAIFDLDGDRDRDTDDVLVLLANWGPCPLP
jgi:hypothetical protein